MASRAMALAAAHGLPELRELVVKPYVLLHAHGNARPSVPHGEVMAEMDALIAELESRRRAAK